MAVSNRLERRAAPSAMIATPDHRGQAGRDGSTGGPGALDAAFGGSLYWRGLGDGHAPDPPNAAPER